MAGKGYPSRSASALPKPKPDYPSAYPDNDNRPNPKGYRRPPGRFPNPYKRPSIPFGRRFPTMPTFQRFPVYPRIPFPWLLLGAEFVLPMIYRQPRTLMPDGWRMCYDLGGIKNMFSGPYANAKCPTIANYQPGGDWAGGPINIPATSVWIGIFWGTKVAPNRMNHREEWVRPPNYPAQTIPLGKWYPIAFPDFPFLDLDPEFWRPLDPTPYRPEPFPRQRPRPRPRPDPRPDKPVEPDTPVQPEDKVPDMRIDPKPRARPRPRPHERRPPKPHEKESKWTSGKGRFGRLAALLLRLAARTHGGATELVDLLAAIYKALPDEVIARGPDNLPRDKIIPFMLGEIWRNRNDIDFGEALENIVENQIEDWLWGRYFAAVDKISRRGPYYVGFDRELGELNELFKELYP